MTQSQDHKEGGFSTDFPIYWIIHDISDTLFSLTEQSNKYSTKEVAFSFFHIVETKEVIMGKGKKRHQGQSTYNIKT